MITIATLIIFMLFHRGIFNSHVSFMTFLEFSDITMTAYISYAWYARSYTKFFIKLPQNM